jgi:hypothetical protein
MFVMEALLNWVKLSILCQTFDCDCVAAVRLNRKQRTGFDRSAVEYNGTGSAICRITSDMRSGKIEHLSQIMDQQQSGLDIAFVFCSIHCNLDAHFTFLPWLVPKPV